MPEKRRVDMSPPPSYVAWGGSMREVPDMLIAAQLSLRPLAKGEAPPTAEEARRIVGDACDLLHRTAVSPRSRAIRASVKHRLM